MRIICLLAFSLGATMAAAQPRFDEARVLVANRDYRAQLMPGMEISIYGKGLGPETACLSSPNSARPVRSNPKLPAAWKARKLFSYPLELCGVQVKLGQLAAELLYVQEEQINFRVPQMVELGSTPALVVKTNGVESAPLTIEIGLQVMAAAVKKPAYTDMPVWVELKTPDLWLPEVRYPFDLEPPAMGCNEIELRRNGQQLEPSWLPSASGTRLNLNCGSLGVGTKGLEDRIPLHLVYRMNPGDYEVRVLKKTNKQLGSEIIAASNWAAFKVLPSRAGMRKQLLLEMKTNVPEDVAALLSDYLPNLLGVPDAESFEMLHGFIEHPHTYIRLYAAAAYRYWKLEPPKAGGVF